MAVRITSLIKLPSTRLSRRIAVWVFVSVIVIEAIILIPSYRNRRQELLSQLADLSGAKIAVMAVLTPAASADAVLMNYVRVLSHHPPVAGGAVYDDDGKRVGGFGEAPALTYADVHDRGTLARLSPDGARYDVFFSDGHIPNDYSLVIRHDAGQVRQELVAFILRIAGLVLIISLFVTAGAWIALDPIVITPILRLRNDLISAGEAIIGDRPTPEFSSLALQRRDELGDVIGAFKKMYRQIAAAVAERKQAEKALQMSFEQVEAYSQAMRKELEKGRRMQMNFLPALLPQLPGWEIAAYFKPARQVAGDFYDVYELPDGRVALVVADVCDKGVGAALFMGLFRSLLRVFSGQGDMGCMLPSARSAGGNRPGEALSGKDPMLAVALTNDYVAVNHDALTMFATLFFGLLDPRTGGLVYINAGQEPVFLVAPGGKVRQRLGTTGPAVGFQAHIDFGIREIRMAPGDLLLAYTDGVTEAAGADGELFSNERILRLLSQPADSAQDLVDRLVRRVLTHTGEAEQSDDITLLALRRRPSGRGRLAGDLPGGLADQGPAHLHPPPCIRPEERPVADDVDQPRHPAGQPVDQTHGRHAEKRPLASGDLQAVLDISHRFLGPQGQQVVTRGDPLGELAQLRPVHEAFQLGLTEEQNLEQFVGGGFQVGQQPDLLQDLGAQVLGFVDDQHRPPSRGMGGQEVPVEPVDQDLDAGGSLRVVDVQLVADGGHQFGAVQLGVEDQGHVDQVGNLLEEASAQGGFAGAHLAGDLNEPPHLAHAVQKVRQGLPVLLAQEKKARVGRQGKRLFLELKIVEVHGGTLAVCFRNEPGSGKPGPALEGPGAACRPLGVRFAPADTRGA